MARSHNRVTILGNVGQAPEVRTTGSGKKVANFSVATSPPWNDQETHWHRIVCWEKLAEIIEQYLSKGDRVMVEGRLTYSSWTDDAGNNRKNAEVVAGEVILLGKKVRAQKGPGSGGDMPF